MDRQLCIKKIFRISDKYKHSLEIEQMAIYIVDHYEYSKEMAYIASILSAKFHKRGYYHLQKASYILNDPDKKERCNLYRLEKQILTKLNYQLFLPHFIYYVTLLTNKPLSIDFMIISRFLSYHNIKLNFYTTIILIQLIKTKLFKYKKAYQLLLLVSEKYDIDIKELIQEYNLI